MKIAKKIVWTQEWYRGNVGDLSEPWEHVEFRYLLRSNHPRFTTRLDCVFKQYREFSNLKTCSNFYPRNWETRSNLVDKISSWGYTCTHRFEVRYYTYVRYVTLYFCPLAARRKDLHSFHGSRHCWHDCHAAERHVECVSLRILKVTAAHRSSCKPHATRRRLKTFLASFLQHVCTYVRTTEQRLRSTRLLDLPARSTHPGTHLRRYQFLFESTTPRRNWSLINRPKSIIFSIGSLTHASPSKRFDNELPTHLFFNRSLKQILNLLPRTSRTFQNCNILAVSSIFKY